MRIPFLFVLTVFTTLCNPVWASADQWQTQLQQNIQSIQAASSAVSVRGNVAVTTDNNLWRATLPDIGFKNSDNSVWHISGIVLTRPANENTVTITLPKSVTETAVSGAPVGAVMIGEQNLKGMVNPSTGRFQSLQGQLKNINIQHNVNNAKASIDQVAISTPSSKALKVVVTGMQGSSTVEGKSYAAQAKAMDYTYTFNDAGGLGLEQIIALLRQNYIGLSKNPVTVAVNANDVNFQTDGLAHHIDGITSQVMVTPKSDNTTADVRNHVVLNGLSRTPEKVNDVFLPRTVEMTGSVNSLPISILSFSPANDVQTMKTQMANAKTRVNFDTIKMITKDGARLSGNGWLNANKDVPTGFTGRLTFKTENMDAVTTSLQKRMAQPGANMAEQGQAMLSLMLMQGFGVQKPTGSTQFVLDMTADGQVLMNGKDIAPLVNLGLGNGLGAVQSPESAPAAPETDGNGEI